MKKPFITRDQELPRIPSIKEYAIVPFPIRLLASYGHVLTYIDHKRIRKNYS